jgi:multidrug efflux system membrane fusion protein
MIDIDNTKISSPFSGIINNSYVEIGDYVRPGNVLFSVVDLNPIKIQGYLSETDINKIKLGTKAIVVNSNSIAKTGEITFISPTAETSTRTFEMTIEANNDDLLFKSGITASITIKGSDIKAHKIPPSILTLQDDGTMGVKAIDEDNKVIFYPIKKEIDTIDGMWVSGLPNQVKIILTGQEYITVGQIVEID